MVVDAGALQVLAGAEELLSFQRLAPEPLMLGGALRPCAAPVVPRQKGRRDLLEIGQGDAVGDEARRPMGDGRADAGVWRRRGVVHGLQSSRPSFRPSRSSGEGRNPWLPIMVM